MGPAVHSDGAVEARGHGVCSAQQWVPSKAQVVPGDGKPEDGGYLNCPSRGDTRGGRQPEVMGGHLQCLTRGFIMGDSQGTGEPWEVA